MGITIALGIALAVVLVGGVLAWLLAPARQAAPAAGPKPLPLPLFILGAASVVAFVFMLCSGYNWLAQVAGQGAADTVYLIFSVGVPVLATLVCGVYFALHRYRLGSFLLAWGCLLVSVVGVGTLALSHM